MLNHCAADDAVFPQQLSVLYQVFRALTIQASTGWRVSVQLGGNSKPATCFLESTRFAWLLWLYTMRRIFLLVKERTCGRNIFHHCLTAIASHHALLRPKYATNNLRISKHRRFSTAPIRDSGTLRPVAFVYMWAITRPFAFMLLTPRVGLLCLPGAMYEATGKIPNK